MAEEGKAAAGLNLGGLKSNPNPVPPQSQPDANAQPKADNADQTQMQSGTTTQIDNIVHEAAAQAAADAGVVAPESGEKIWSSHPVTGLQVGRFRFENGTLRLSDPEDIKAFEAVLKVLPPADRNMIRTLDMSKVDAIVEQRRSATRQFDSSVGRLAMKALRDGTPTIGVEDISHAALPQSDNNIPMPPIASTDPEGKTGLDQGPHTNPNP